jgi:hypothetical protein
MLVCLQLPLRWSPTSPTRKLTLKPLQFFPAMLRQRRLPTWGGQGSGSRPPSLLSRPRAVLGGTFFIMFVVSMTFVLFGLPWTRIRHDSKVLKEHAQAATAPSGQASPVALSQSPSFLLPPCTKSDHRNVHHPAKPQPSRLAAIVLASEPYGDVLSLAKELVKQSGQLPDWSLSIYLVPREPHRLRLLNAVKEGAYGRLLENGAHGAGPFH